MFTTTDLEGGTYKTMMNLRFRTTGAVLLLGMAIGAQAQITSGAAGYTFRVKYTPGKTVSNQMTITSGINMGGAGAKPMNFVMDMPMKMKCTGQKGDVYTVQTTSGPMTMNGKPAPGNAKAQTMTMKVNSKGQIVEGGGGQEMNFANVKMPDKPIKVGQSWKGTVNLPQGQGTVDATYTFKAVKAVNGKQCAVIGVAMTLNGGMGKMSGTGSMNLLMADGLPLNMNMNMNGNVNPGAAGGGSASGSSSMKMTMAVKLVRK